MGSGDNGQEQIFYSSTEAKIADIWKIVLALEDSSPNIDVSFLDLGGDSLSAVACVSRLRNAFGPDLDTDISDFFDEKSTIRNLAASIDRYNSTEL